MLHADGGGDGGSGFWMLLNHPGVVLILAVVVLLLLLAGGITVWVVVRKLRRSAVFGRSLLQLRAQGLPEGPVRELASLRLSLQRATDYTVESVALAEQAGQPIGDLAGLTQRLTRLSSAVDNHLRWLEREPDSARLQTLLPMARQRTNEVTTAASRIRNTLGQFVQADSGTEIDALTADVATEVEALQAGVESLRESGDSDAGPGTRPTA
ncbi:MAG: hypothetical protein ACR2LE_08660 [Nocardioidaceae bacterium]